MCDTMSTKRIGFVDNGDILYLYKYPYTTATHIDNVYTTEP